MRCVNALRTTMGAHSVYRDRGLDRGARSRALVEIEALSAAVRSAVQP